MIDINLLTNKIDEYVDIRYFDIKDAHCLIDYNLEDLTIEIINNIESIDCIDLNKDNNEIYMWLIYRIEPRFGAAIRIKKPTLNILYNIWHKSYNGHKDIKRYIIGTKLMDGGIKEKNWALSIVLGDND